MNVLQCNGCHKPIQEASSVNYRPSHRNDAVKLCSRCKQAFDKGWYCVHCLQTYIYTSDEDDKMWIGCDLCNHWAHKMCVRRAGLTANERKQYVCIVCQPLESRFDAVSAESIPRKRPKVEPVSHLLSIDGSRMPVEDLANTYEIHSMLLQNTSHLKDLETSMKSLEEIAGDDPEKWESRATNPQHKSVHIQIRKNFEKMQKNASQLGRKLEIDTSRVVPSR